MKSYKLGIPVEKDGLDLLLYEIRTFNQALPFGADYRGVELINARLESFLMHARNLIDFLENNRNGLDDITCHDFKDKNGESVSAITVDLEQDIKQKINKHMTHLTRTRLEEKPSWCVGLITKKINQALRRFLNQISNEHFPTKAGRDKGDFLSVLDE